MSDKAYQEEVSKMLAYRIPKHVYFCQSGAETVFLDLKRNRYSAINNKHASLLDDLVDGWCAGTAHEDQAAREQEIDTDKVVETLLSKGLLTKSIADGKKAQPTSIDSAILDLHREYRSIPSVHISQFGRFLVSSMTAFLMLRIRSLEQIVQSVENKKTSRKRNVNEADLGRTLELVLVYQALRPFFFRGKDACLVDSLALLEFLRRHGVHTTWVIGVMTGPFRAHSWLQQGRTVLNDRLVRVNMFTPILAI